MAKTRYFYTFESKDQDNNFRKFDTTLYPKVEQQEDDTIIVSKSGDRLDLLAYKYYGDVTLWWVIAQANQIGKGTLNVLAGTTLRIPQSLEKIYTKLDIINRNR